MGDFYRPLSPVKPRSFAVDWEPASFAVATQPPIAAPKVEHVVEKTAKRVQKEIEARVAAIDVEHCRNSKTPAMRKLDAKLSSDGPKMVEAVMELKDVQEKTKVDKAKKLKHVEDSVTDLKETIKERIEQTTTPEASKQAATKMIEEIKVPAPTATDPFTAAGDNCYTFRCDGKDAVVIKCPMRLGDDNTKSCPKKPGDECKVMRLPNACSMTKG